MKKFYFLLVFLVTTNFNAFSQTVTDIATTSAFIFSAEIYNNHYYFTDYSGGTLSKIDLADTTFTVVDVLTGLVSPTALAVKGDELYMGLLSSSSMGKIVKIDLTDTLATPVDVVSTGVGGLIDMAFYNDELYWAEANFGNRVAKADVSVATPTIIDVATGTNAAGIYIVGDDLYYADGAAGSIKHIDLTSATPTPVDVVTGLVYPQGVYVIGNEMYIANTGGSTVQTADISQTLPTTSTSLFSRTAYHLIFDSDNNYMYMSESGGTISRFNVFAVSTNNVLANPDWSIFPNPAQDMIQLQDLEEAQQYQIFNGIGQLVQEGTVAPNQQVSVNGLASGMHVLRLENGEIQQFVKN